MKRKNKPNILAMRMTPAVAQKRVYTLAKITENVIFTNHALERMEQRDIADYEVYDILRTGHIDSIQACKFKEGFECKMTKHLPGRREAGVVTAVKDKTGNLLIITVEWEDLK